MKKSFLIIFLLFLPHLIVAQNTIKQEVSDSLYTPPLKIPLLLAGNFGELRSDHFHAGLDIKTKHQQGLKVFPTANGYVSRIKISHWGYGKVLYVTHYNGTTSVYAHLQKFSPKIESFVQEKQYSKKSYTIHLFPKKEQIKVFKDSVIAYSGNTGGSSAPHLHFEMRKTGTAIALNPLKYPFNVLDNTPPTIQKLYAYPWGKDNHINKSEHKVQLRFKKTTEGNYQASPIHAKGSFYIGVKGYDRQELTANKNGIYQYSISQDNELLSEVFLDQFSFNETKEINTLIDYPHLIKNRERIVQLFQDSQKPLSIFKTIKNKGLIKVLPQDTSSVKITLADLNNNSTTIIIPVIGVNDSSVIKRKVLKTPFPIRYNKPAHYKLKYASLYFPSNTFYKDVYLEIEAKKDTLKVHKPMWPIKKSFTLNFNPENTSFSKYSYIAYALSPKKFIYNNTKKEDGWLSTKTNKLGTYVIKQDSIAPSVRPKNFKNNQNIKNYKFLSLEIKDLETGVKSYTASINGRWILMEYEPKTNTITHHIGTRTLLQKDNELVVEVEDMVGNKKTYTATLKK